MAAATERDISNDVTSPCHCPNRFFIQLVNGSSMREFSANSSEREISPSNALLMLPSAGGIVRYESTTECSEHFTQASFHGKQPV